MISYYPNAMHLNEAFDKAFVYEQGNPEQERAATMRRCKILCLQWRFYQAGGASDRLGALLVYWRQVYLPA